MKLSVAVSLTLELEVNGRYTVDEIKHIARRYSENLCVFDDSILLDRQIFTDSVTVTAVDILGNGLANAAAELGVNKETEGKC